MADPLVTLIIRHLPSDLTAEEREELLRHFGAIRVRCMSDVGKMKNSAFADFPSKEAAGHALSRLHQMEVLGHRLVVQFARDHHKKYFPHESDFPKFKKEKQEVSTKISEKEEIRLKMEEFSKKIHGIAPSLGLDYLPSPLLKYKYPAPTPSIITNIVHALAAVPLFYTQVLHLMNKMGLPAPFGLVTPPPPMAPDETIVPVKTVRSPVEGFADRDVLEEEEMEVTTSAEESELESEEEDIGHRKPELVLPVKRPAQQPKKKRKKPKLQKLLPTTPACSGGPGVGGLRTDPADVFEPHSSIDGQGKKIQFNIKPTLDSDQIKIDLPKEIDNTDNIEKGGFGVIAPKKVDSTGNSDNESGVESWDDSNFIRLDELRRKRITYRDMKTMSVFRNYEAGEPTIRLYIKNLAKQVDEKDLRYIFGRFINRTSETDRNMFDIRLMKEGRMKGQAFVTLAQEEQAVQAVKETNGFILHTKPLVVQFARSAKPKESEKKIQKKS